MDPLAKLFGSSARIKLLRLFLFNEEEWYTPSEAAFRAKAGKAAARKEILSLFSNKVLRKKMGKVSGSTTGGKVSGSPTGGKGGTHYAANPKFAHYESLRTFLRTSSGVDDQSIGSSLKKVGTLRLVVLSGLFTGVPESKIDMLIVGDRLNERTLASVVHILEAELGRELRYASFSTEDFRYRVGVYDRLIRDVLDYPHRLVLDKIGL